MKLIYKIVFILCIFILTLGVNVSSADDNSFLQKESVITSVQNSQFDITNKDNTEIISTEFTNEIQSSQRIKNLQNGNLNPYHKELKSQFKRLISYIYSKSYLEKVKNRNLLYIAYEISPNAP